MNNIIFYINKDGRSEIQEYLTSLQQNNDKDSRVKFNKIVAYINMLEKNGLQIGQPYIKHLEDEIWELRPLRDRILFAYYENNTFILLNVFVKKTQKTPRREIKKAQKLLKDFRKKE